MAMAAGAVLLLGATIAVVATRSNGGDERDGAGIDPGGRPPSSAVTTPAPSSTTSTAATTTTTTAATTTTTTTAPPRTSPPAPGGQPTVPRPATTTTIPEGAIDLGSGVHLHVPPGWQQVSGPDEPLTISDGTTWYSAQVHQREPGEGPAPVLQDVVDSIDAGNAAVSYSPVRYRGTVTGALPADEYALVYSAIGGDGGRLSGWIQAFVRGDGLVLVADAWNTTDTSPDPAAVPQAVTDGVQRSLTSAPKLGAAETLPVSNPFRVASAHPIVSPHGLAGFTVPPGFQAWPPSVSGDMTIAGATNGATDLVAIAMPAPSSVEAVFATVTADLEERYPGIVIGTPTPQGTRDGVQRLGAGYAGTLRGRPFAGGLDVWLVGGDTAYAFAYTYFADVQDDGSNPDADATQFAYSAYADSF